MTEGTSVTPEDATKPPPPVDDHVEVVRAHAGLMAVVFGDVVIALAAIIGMVEVHGTGNSDAIVSILTSAFTAIGTLSTAYFGIKAVANTAKTVVATTR